MAVGSIKRELFPYRTTTVLQILGQDCDNMMPFRQRQFTGYLLDSWQPSHTVYQPAIEGSDHHLEPKPTIQRNPSYFSFCLVRQPQTPIHMQTCQRVWRLSST